jgi:hypothetical protein
LADRINRSFRAKRKISPGILKYGKTGSTVQDGERSEIICFLPWKITI